MDGILAPVLALSAGALFGANLHVQRHALKGADPLVGAFYSVLAMAAVFWLVAPFFVELAWIWTLPAALFAIGGLVFPAAGQAFQIFAIRQVGPALTAAIGSFVPFIAAFPAVLFLNERLGIQGALAMSLMVGGLLLAAWPRKGIPRGFAIWALALPLGAALARGLVQPVTRGGLEIGTNAIFATLVQGTVSACVLLALVLVTGRGGQVARASGGARWFAVSGVVNGLGILCVNAALGLGDVTVVSPLVATTPLWAVGLGALGLGPERPQVRHAGVAALVFLGAVLLLTR